MQYTVADCMHAVVHNRQHELEAALLANRSVSTVYWQLFTNHSDTCEQPRLCDAFAIVLLLERCFSMVYMYTSQLTVHYMNYTVTPVITCVPPRVLHRVVLPCYVLSYT